MTYGELRELAAEIVEIANGIVGLGIQQRIAEQTVLNIYTAAGAGEEGLAAVERCIAEWRATAEKEAAALNAA